MSVVASQPESATGQDRKHGLGNMTYQDPFSPAPKPGGLIWGIGQAIRMGTASDDRLGSGKWAGGPMPTPTFELLATFVSTGKG
jgi:hypothetical protein